MIYLDFAKAFDTVDHSVLLEKLRLYGVKGQLLCWFLDCLTERTQRVVPEGAASHWSPVTSGVPQGSILRPVLFTLFVNDLPDEAADGVKTALFADDTKLYRNVSSSEHCDPIQATLSNMQDWSQRNNIRFNTSKCKTLTVTGKKTPIVLDFTIDGTTLTRVSEEKDFSVIITSTRYLGTHTSASSLRKQTSFLAFSNGQVLCLRMSLLGFPVFGQVTAVLRDPSLIARSCYSEC